MTKYFIYCRKSTEDEGKQVLSIESQKKELIHLAENLNLSVVEILCEAKSAKAPGRVIFNQMIERIERNEATGIICWKLDRLTRNPIDGGRINWLLQQGIISHIQTFDRSFYSKDNVLPLDVEMSMANQYIRDLSTNVKRGLRRKLEQGWYPSIAPMGYLNSPFKEKGHREITKDPARFRLVKKMWDKLLSGNYTPAQIADIANYKWGFRTRKSKKLGGNPLSLSGIYRIFSNPFYCGLFCYNGQLYKGKHEPMVTIVEYEQARQIVQQNTKSKPKQYSFAYTGLIQCGECGSSITAENKKKVNKTDGRIHHYTYYHCTKKKRELHCSQPVIEVKVLEQQIIAYLREIEIPEDIKNWALKYLVNANDQEERDKADILQSIKQTREENQKQLTNLIGMRMKDLISDTEFIQRKTELTNKNEQLQEKLKTWDKEFTQVNTLTAQTFIFACYALFWFKNGTLEDKKAIVRILGSNLVLKNKKLSIDALKPFLLIKNAKESVCQEIQRFEPAYNVVNMRWNELFEQHIPTGCALVEDVRTCWKDTIKAGNDWIGFKYKMKELLKSKSMII